MQIVQSIFLLLRHARLQPQVQSSESTCLAAGTAPDRGVPLAPGAECALSAAVAADQVPNSVPTPAVTPMARAPQKVTRSAPTVTPAPPARAANPPRSARNNSEVPETRGIRPACEAKLVTTREGGVGKTSVRRPANGVSCTCRVRSLYRRGSD